MRGNGCERMRMIEEEVRGGGTESRKEVRGGGGERRRREMDH